VGFELAAAIPERIRSLTLVNTVVDVETVPSSDAGLRPACNRQTLAGSTALAGG
jgi:hypothetical protein